MASSGPELDLEFLTTRGRTMLRVPKGVHIPMCFCGDNSKLIKCKVLKYAYRMRFFMCTNYVHHLIKPLDHELRAKVITY
jgi:hypothetical protein